METKNLSKWDSYRQIFVKYIFTKNLDFEDDIPAHVQIIQYFSLFFCDFIFTFISGFGKYDENQKKLITNFSRFENFYIFGLKFLSKSYENILSLYEFSRKKDNFFKVDCEKTEYLLTDKLNSYGVYFIVSIALNFYYINSSEEIIYFSNNEKKRILSSAYSYNFLLDKLFFCFGNLINAEKNQKKSLCPIYLDYIQGYLSNYLMEFNRKDVNEILFNPQYRRNFCFFLINYFKIEENEINKTLKDFIFGQIEV
jgi:hypothetical protein